MAGIVAYSSLKPSSQVALRKGLGNEFDLRPNKAGDGFRIDLYWRFEGKPDLRYHKVLIQTPLVERTSLGTMRKGNWGRGLCLKLEEGSNLTTWFEDVQSALIDRVHQAGLMEVAFPGVPGADTRDAVALAFRPLIAHDDKYGDSVWMDISYDGKESNPRPRTCLFFDQSNAKKPALEFETLMGSGKCALEVAFTVDNLFFYRNRTTAEPQIQLTLEVCQVRYRSLGLPQTCAFIGNGVTV